MKNFDIHFAYWLSRRIVSHLGLIGLVGIFILLLCGLLFITNILPEKLEISESKINLAQAQVKTVIREQGVEISDQPDSSINTTTQDVMEFYQLFPAGATLPMQIELIEKMALKQKIALNRGDYKLTKAKQGQLMRYEIIFPLEGSYTQIRQFIVAVLQKIPALALSDMQIKRENVATPTVQARLVFTLFLQGDSWLK
jgi:Tfp pilus assembly protein PilO